MTIRHPVHIIQSADLKENGGRYELMGGAVIPVDHSTLNVAAAAGDRIIGGSLTPVYFVTDAQLATNRFKLMGGRSERRFNEHVVAGVASRGIAGKIAIPVYDPNYSPTPPAEPDWWDPNNEGLCVWAAYQPVGAASFAASLVDLTGNGNNAGDPGGAATPVWDAVNGWQPDGLATYLTTTFVPATDQSQSMLVQFTNAAVSNGRIAGAQAAADRRFSLVPNSAAGSNTYENGGLVNAAPGGFAAGNIGVAGNQGYRDGVADGAAIGAWGAAIPDTVYIGAWGVPAGFFKDVDIQAFVIYDCILTAPQMLAVATAMAALS